MENINIIINKKTRQVFLSKNVIGNDGENLQENLIFLFEDEFVNGTARLELIKPNTAPSYVMLEKVNETYQIPVKSIITKGGKINMQLVITEGTNDEEIPIFKSNEFYMIVNSSINAQIEEPDEYPEWIDVANTKLNQLDSAISESSNLNISTSKSGTTTTVTLTDKDGQTSEVSILDGTDGTDGVSPIATVTKNRGSSATITITDVNGTTSAVIYDGEKGEPGKDGENGANGQNGITPTIGDNGNWYLGSTDTGKPSRGIQGATGQTGANGQDGVSPTVTTSKSGTVTTITITDKNGDHTATINDGVNGTNGSDGRDGYVQYTAGNNISIENNVISALSGGGIAINELPLTSSSSPFDFTTANKGIYLIKTGDVGQTFYYKQNSTTTAQIKFQRILMFFIIKSISEVTGQEPIGYYYYVSGSTTASENGKFYYNSVLYSTSNESISLGSTPIMFGHFITTNAQSFTGKKTFGVNPYVSSYMVPYDNNELAPKKYVDDSIASAITTTLSGNY